MNLCTAESVVRSQTSNEPEANYDVTKVKIFILYHCFTVTLNLGLNRESDESSSLPVIKRHISCCRVSYRV